MPSRNNVWSCAEKTTRCLKLLKLPEDLKHPSIFIFKIYLLVRENKKASTNYTAKEFENSLLQKKVRVPEILENFPNGIKRRYFLFHIYCLMGKFTMEDVPTTTAVQLLLSR